MARYDYGGSGYDVATKEVTVSGTAVLALDRTTTLWVYLSDGTTRVTDLQTTSGAAITEIVVTSAGIVPRFRGPDGHNGRLILKLSTAPGSAGSEIWPSLLPERVAGLEVSKAEQSALDALSSTVASLGTGGSGSGSGTDVATLTDRVSTVEGNITNVGLQSGALDTRVTGIEGTLAAALDRLAALEAGGGTGGGGGGGGTTGPDYVTSLSSTPVIGNRGDASAAENTAEGITRALSIANATYHEVRTTSDGVPVLMADSTIDRTTTSTGTVVSKTGATWATLAMKSPFPEWASLTVRPATLASALSAAGVFAKPLVLQPMDSTALTATVNYLTANLRTKAAIVVVTADGSIPTVTGAGIKCARLVTAASEVSAAVSAGASYIIVPDTLSDADITASVSAATTAVPVWLMKASRLTMKASYVALGVSGFIADQGLYLGRTSGGVDRANWRTGRLPAGVLPFRTSTVTHSPPTISAVTDGELQIDSLTNTRQWLMMGNMSPVDMSTAGYMTWKVRNIANPTVGTGQPFCSIFFACPTDAGADIDLSSGTDQTHRDGYVINIRPDGNISLWYNQANGTKGALIAANATAAIPVNGTAVIKIQWDQNADGTASAGRLVLSRTDTTPTYTFTVSNATSALYRGGYWHFGKYHAGAKASLIDVGVRQDVGAGSGGGGSTGGALFLAGTSNGPYRSTTGSATQTPAAWVADCGQPAIWRAYNGSGGWGNPVTTGQSSSLLSRGDRVWVSCNPSIANVLSGASNSAIDSFFDALADVNRVSLFTPWHEPDAKVPEADFWPAIKHIGQRLANKRAGAGGAKYQNIKYGTIETAYSWYNTRKVHSRVPTTLTSEVTDWMDFFAIDDYPNSINQLSGWVTPEQMVTDGDKGNVAKDYYAYARNLGLLPGIGEMGVYSEQPSTGRRYPALGPQPSAGLSEAAKDTFYRKRRADFVEEWYQYSYDEGCLSVCYWEASPYEGRWSIELPSPYPQANGGGQVPTRSGLPISVEKDPEMAAMFKRVFAKWPG